jgi:hypothetical protein
MLEASCFRYKRKQRQQDDIIVDLILDTGILEFLVGGNGGHISYADDLFGLHLMSSISQGTKKLDIFHYHKLLLKIALESILLSIDYGIPSVYAPAMLNKVPTPDS